VKKIISIILACLLLSGCAGLGLNKRATLMPDEMWIGGDSNHDNEDSGEYSFGFKWKFEKPKGE